MGQQSFHPSSIPLPELPFPQVRLCGRASGSAWLLSPHQAGWDILLVTPWVHGVDFLWDVHPGAEALGQRAREA